MIVDLIINVLASAILVGIGYLVGQFRERKVHKGKSLEEYNFYPFSLDEQSILFFDREKFFQGAEHLRKHRDEVAGQQLVLIGEQNYVQEDSSREEQRLYRRLYRKYNGDKILDDMDKYLTNYKRIVRLIGDSFPDSGIEILLHNLTNPAKALYHIKNNVTGRNVEAPATNLVMDLKKRRVKKEDKLNYELNIGSRKFKCTTIPIFRERFGLVGAICINVDYNYLDEVVRKDEKSLDKFIDSLIKTDMQLDENILSKHEYDQAQQGKRHFRDYI